MPRSAAASISVHPSHAAGDSGRTKTVFGGFPTTNDPRMHVGNAVADPGPPHELTTRYVGRPTTQAALLHRGPASTTLTLRRLTSLRLFTAERIAYSRRDLGRVSPNKRARSTTGCASPEAWMAGPSGSTWTTRRSPSSASRWKNGSRKPSRRPGRSRAPESRLGPGAAGPTLRGRRPRGRTDGLGTAEERDGGRARAGRESRGDRGRRTCRRPEGPSGPLPPGSARHGGAWAP